VLWNISRRKRAIRRSLGHEGALDPGVRSRLETSFATGAPLAEGTLSRSKALARALRAQAWISTPKRRAHAAALLRDWVDFLERSGDAERAIPLASETFAHPDSGSASTDQVRAAFLSAAAKLENGGRIVRWRSWLASLDAGDIDADRDGLYAIDRLARLHGVSRPRWFRAWSRMYAQAHLTETDIAPPWNLAAPSAKSVAVMIAVIVLASAVLSTATAQTPLDDSRRLPVISGPSAESRIEPRLSRVASSLAGRRAEVRCWSREDWKRLALQRTGWIHRSRSRLGPWSAYASKDHLRAHLAPAICASLVRLAYERIPVESDRWPAALAFSVATLAHEAQHLRGVSNEALAECYGMQSIAVAARKLGRTEEEGRYLAWRFWEKQYPNHRNPAYMSEECRDGGRLDLRPQVDVWP
jgi:transposase-like protein